MTLSVVFVASALFAFQASSAFADCSAETKCIGQPSAGSDLFMPVKRVVTGAGTGSRPVEATMAKVMLTLEATRRTGGAASEVRADLTERSKSQLDLLKDKNVEKLQTGGVSASRKSRHGLGSLGADENTYKGSSMVSFEVPLARVDQVQDKVADSKGVSESSISPFAAKEDVEAARKEVFGEAVKKAREEAQMLATAIGVQLGGEVSIRIANNMPSKPPSRFDLQAASLGSAYPYPKPGETVLVDVQIVYKHSPLDEKK